MKTLHPSTIRRFHLRPHRIPMDTLRVKHSAVLDLVTTLLGEVVLSATSSTLHFGHGPQEEVYSVFLVPHE